MRDKNRRMFSPAMATVATKRKNGNGTTERHNGTAEQNSETATVATKRKNGNGTTERHNGTTERQNRTAKRQRQNGNGMVETRHNRLG